MRLLIPMLIGMIAVSAQASPVTLNFDDLSSVESSFQTQDYSFSTSSGFFVPVQKGPAPNIGIGLSGFAPFAMAQVGGGVFSIYSLDMSEDTVGDGVNVTGYLQGGGQVNTTFTRPVTPNVFTTFLFGSEWQGLTSISFTISNSSGSPAVLDNIVVSAVPIPAAVWLFGSALAGLAWIRRKQTV